MVASQLQPENAPPLMALSHPPFPRFSFPAALLFTPPETPDILASLGGSGTLLLSVIADYTSPGSRVKSPKSGSPDFKWPPESKLGVLGPENLLSAVWFLDCLGPESPSFPLFACLSLLL